jgi:hypothetical protein
MKPGIYDKTLCYLTPEALQTVELLVSKGCDRDLAVSMLEVFAGEAIYELPDAEGESASELCEETT